MSLQDDPLLQRIGKRKKSKINADPVHHRLSGLFHLKYLSKRHMDAPEAKPVVMYAKKS